MVGTADLPPGFQIGKAPMNQIIYLVGVIVIVLFVLGYFGLR